VFGAAAQLGLGNAQIGTVGLFTTSDSRRRRRNVTFPGRGRRSADLRRRADRLPSCERGMVLMGVPPTFNRLLGLIELARRRGVVLDRQCAGSIK